MELDMESNPSTSLPRIAEAADSDLDQGRPLSLLVILQILLFTEIWTQRSQNFRDSFQDCQAYLLIQFEAHLSNLGNVSAFLSFASFRLSPIDR